MDNDKSSPHDSAMAQRIGFIRKHDAQVRAFVEGGFAPEAMLHSCAHRQADRAADMPLAGMLLGVKDIINVDGYPTRCGSALPHTLFDGPQASCVTRLCNAGAIVAGKTVTAEFAISDPGATRNPRNLAHTPGGSSSGSAAAVAAGFCDIAIGTQTSGSTIRPAGYCGVIGYKPSFGRIARDGVFPFSTSMDHVGLFTSNLMTLQTVVPLLVDGWHPLASGTETRICVGIPEGSYIDLATKQVAEHFSNVVSRLERPPCTLKRLSITDNISDHNDMVDRITCAELYRVHSAWFDDYRDVYRPMSRDSIEFGKLISDQELEALLHQAKDVRVWMQSLMNENDIDIWIAPMAPNLAPKGIASTGDYRMNSIWSYTGLPVLTIPTGVNDWNLPFGVQIVGRYEQDERMLRIAKSIEEVIGAGLIKNEWDLN